MTATTNSTARRILPANLFAAHVWTEAAGELEQLAALTGDALDAYVSESAENAAEHGESVSESDLRGLAVWLRAGRGLVNGRLFERGNGLHRARAGEYVPGDGELCRVVFAHDTIHADDARGNYVHAVCERADWSDCEEGDEAPLMFVADRVEG